MHLRPSWYTAPTAPNVYAFQYDQMRYDRATDSYPADQGLSACGISGF